MALDKDTPIFDDISFATLAKDIYKKKKDKDEQLTKLIEHLMDLVKNITDASILVPLIKEYLDIGVKNDEIMVKLSAIVQKLIIANKDANSDNEFGITPEEKRQLLQEVNIDVRKLKKQVDDSR